MQWHALPDQLYSTFNSKQSSSELHSTCATDWQWRLCGNEPHLSEIQQNYLPNAKFLPYFFANTNSRNNNAMQWMSDSNVNSPHIINKHFTHNAFALKYLVHFIQNAYNKWFPPYSICLAFGFFNFIFVESQLSLAIRLCECECKQHSDAMAKPKISRSKLYSIRVCLCECVVCAFRKMWKTSFMQFLFQHIIYVWCRKKLANFLAKY